MLSSSVDPVVELSFDIVSLGWEAHSLIGLRLFAMATGGVPALPEALRMVPEKMTALADAHIIAATGILVGRPDLAPTKIVALYRERVRANAQRLTAS